MMNISDIIEIVIVCALIFSRWVIWRAIHYAECGIPHGYSLPDLVMSNQPER